MGVNGTTFRLLSISSLNIPRLHFFGMGYLPFSTFTTFTTTFPVCGSSCTDTVCVAQKVPNASRFFRQSDFCLYGVSRCKHPICRNSIIHNATSSPVLSSILILSWSTHFVNREFLENMATILADGHVLASSSALNTARTRAPPSGAFSTVSAPPWRSASVRQM